MHNTCSCIGIKRPHDYVKKMTSPNKDSIPLPTQTIRLSPTDPVSVRTPFGEINMPEPEKNDKGDTEYGFMIRPEVFIS